MKFIRKKLSQLTEHDDPSVLEMVPELGVLR